MIDPPDLDSSVGAVSGTIKRNTTAAAEVSRLAWPILSAGADYFMTIPEAAAADTMKILADSPYGDVPVVGGPSGVASLVGALIAAAQLEVRQTLALNAESDVLTFGSEGATERALYRRLVGRDPEDVVAT